MKLIEAFRNKGNIARIVIEDTVFHVAEGSVDVNGEITQKNLKDAVDTLFYAGFMERTPAVMYALTTKKKPAVVKFSYANGRPINGAANIWTKAPNVNAALCDLARQAGKEGILLVPPNFDANEANFVENAAHKDENSFSRLSEYKGKVYDGALKHSELEPFIGFSFGDPFGGSFSVRYVYKGSEIYHSPLSDELPKPGDIRHIHRCEFQITTVKHEKFEKENDALCPSAKIFKQLLKANLCYNGYLGKQTRP